MNLTALVVQKFKVIGSFSSETYWVTIKVFTSKTECELNKAVLLNLMEELSMNSAGATVCLAIETVGKVMGS